MDPLAGGRPLGIASWEMCTFLIPIIITPLAMVFNRLMW